MEINIRIRTTSKSLRREIFQKDVVDFGVKIQIPNSNAFLESKDVRKINATSSIDLLNLGLSFVLGIPTGIIANYLFEKLKGKANTILIGDRETEIIVQRIKEELDILVSQKLENDKSKAAKDNIENKE